MGVDEADFRKAMGQFATGVTVVTTRDASGRNLGLTVSSFCSLSLDPPLVLVCVDGRSEANTGLVEAGLFGVSILAAGQEDVSRRFAKAGSGKFSGFELAEGRLGMGLVPGAVAHVECAVVSAHAEGDHVIYVGRILHLAVFPGEPLVYHRGTYRHLEAQ